MKKVTLVAVVALGLLALAAIGASANTNLLVNGSFELPDIPTGDWAVFPNGAVPGWTIECADPPNADHDPELEFQDNIGLGAAYDGDQYVELDSYDPTKISQGVPTTAGYCYTLGYAWRPRPGVAENEMAVRVDGDQVALHSASGVAGSTWTLETYRYPFPAAGNPTTIAFAELGTDDQLGMFLDAVSLTGEDARVSYCLVAGGGNPASAIDLGEVLVWNDDDTLYVQFVSTGDCLLQTHVHVADSLEGIPQTKKGNPIPGQFDYSDPHLCVNDYTYEIPLTTWSPGTDLFIAAHAALGRQDAMTMVSGDDNTLVTQRRSGGAVGFTLVDLPAVDAWEPGPNYPNDGPDDSGWEQNSLWDQNLSTDLSPTGADWIWEDYRVLDPVYGTVLTLQSTFDIGYPIDGNLLIACDNGYEVFLNGTSIGSHGVYLDWRNSDLKEGYVPQDGWNAVGSYSLLADLVDGTNVLTIDAANEYFNTDDPPNPYLGTASSNPGACIFAADIDYYADGETAWGCGTGFPGKNWATYITYTVGVPCE